MSINELKELICIIQDRMSLMPLCGSRFKAMLIVNRRLIRNLRDVQKALHAWQ